MQDLTDRTLSCDDEPPLFIPNHDLVAFVRITDDLIYKAINQLDSSKAAGPDGISNTLLKACSDSLCYRLVLIFRKSLDTGVFPAAWKHANVIPIWKKKGDKSNLSSYRPISLTSNISKIFERVVYDQWYEFKVIRNLLNPNNSGFKEGDGCINQLLHLASIIHDVLKTKNTLMIFFDIQAAFDRV